VECIKKSISYKLKKLQGELLSFDVVSFSSHVFGAFAGCDSLDNTPQHNEQRSHNETQRKSGARTQTRLLTTWLR
jgi:hypothetical protein